MQRDVPPLDLFLAHRTALLDYATPIVGCRARAEDVVQEAFLRFTQTSNGGEAIGQPVAYLYRIVRNLAIDVTRRLANETLRDGASLEAIVSPAPSPERTAIGRDELRQVAEALDELPERTRRAFEMHRLSGHTFREIARTLGISVGLAHQLVRDALTHCAERLTDDD